MAREFVTLAQLHAQLAAIETLNEAHDQAHAAAAAAAHEERAAAPATAYRAAHEQDDTDTAEQRSR